MYLKYISGMTVVYNSVDIYFFKIGREDLRNQASTIKILKKKNKKKKQQPSLFFHMLKLKFQLLFEVKSFKITFLLQK